MRKYFIPIIVLAIAAALIIYETIKGGLGSHSLFTYTPNKPFDGPNNNPNTGKGNGFDIFSKMGNHDTNDSEDNALALVEDTTDQESQGEDESDSQDEEDETGANEA